MSWGATETQQTKSSDHRIYTVKICFLHAKHSPRKPPHAFGSHKDNVPFVVSLSRAAHA